MQTDEQKQQDSPYYATGIRWKLDDILPARSGQLFTTFIQQLEGSVSEFESARKSLDNRLDAENFQRILQNYEQIKRTISRLASYAYMYFSEDTFSQDARTFRARAEEITTDAQNRILFFELWWKNLDALKSQKLLANSDSYAYFLEYLQKARPYTLKEEVEQAINLKDSTGKSTLLQIYHQIRDSFTYKLKAGNAGSETRHLTEEQVRDLFYSPLREEREAAYEAYHARFRENTDVLGEIYKALARDWRNEGIKLRRYSSPIAVRNLSNDVSDEAVATLLQVCRENASVFQNFFQIKARLLGLAGDFARYDVYAPLPEHAEKKYRWEEAVNLVLETYRKFDPEFSDMAKNVISSSHIDAEVRRGKLGGAYCASPTPDSVPYILTSYTGKARSVSTLAHELGHAVHSQLAAKRSNNQLTFEAPLPLAETASVFGEMILSDRLMAEADEDTRRSLLLELLSDSYATIGRQAFFVLFEQEAHEKIASGVNVDKLSEAYYNNLKAQFGPDIRVPEYFRYEWNSIPHIYNTPFYCYAYAWGNLLVLSLYKQFREEGAKDFVPRYMKILSYGGSTSPEKILAEAGFDIHSKAFWQSGFNELSRLINQLDKIA